MEDKGGFMSSIYYKIWNITKSKINPVLFYGEVDTVHWTVVCGSTIAYFTSP